MNYIKKLIIVISTLFIVSCATVFSENVYPLNVNSSPSATIEVKDQTGRLLYRRGTPVSLLLSTKSNGSKATYYITFNKKGYKKRTVPVTFKTDGWVWGNLLFGGIIGLVIDYSTGAAYKISTTFLNERLTKIKKSTIGYDNKELKIYDLADIPNDLRKDLVLISKKQ